MAQKLMANSDRGLDSATNHRDMLDLIMMCNRWGFDLTAWNLVEKVYKASLRRNTFAVMELLANDLRFEEVCKRLKIESIHAQELRVGLEKLMLHIPKTTQERLAVQERHKKLTKGSDLSGVEGIVQMALGRHLGQAEGMEIDMNQCEENAIVEVLKKEVALSDVVSAILKLSPGCVQIERASIKEKEWLEKDWREQIDHSLTQPCVRSLRL